MNVACFYSNTFKSKALFRKLSHTHDFVDPKDADVILCLGGDGRMLHCIHDNLGYNKPIYGINCGTLGFLMNDLMDTENIIARIQKATPVKIYPLSAQFIHQDGSTSACLAFNEVSILRTGATAAHLQLAIDGITRISKLTADGILVATSIGSTAYNRACGGYVVPFECNLLNITPINPFQPLGWTNTILSPHHKIDIKILQHQERQVKLFCDYHEFTNIQSLQITYCDSQYSILLFDNIATLSEKTMQLQFNNV